MLSEKGYSYVVTRQPHTKTRNVVARAAAMVCASVALAGCIGFGVAVAGGSNAGTFGLSDYAGNASASQTAATEQGSAVSQLASEASDATAADALTTAAHRDISQGVQEISAEEEAARLAAEEKARAEEQARIQAAEAAKAKQREKDADAAASILPDVDWSCGKDAFVAEWTARIDAYLAGSPLAGKGAVFALAAWENGVDPRWSPAISNTESSKGANCFKPYNAWGWGSSGWSNWDEAINAHVAGLASGYGYSITYANAKKYCPPNYDNWYRDTLNQMSLI